MKNVELRYFYETFVSSGRDKSKVYPRYSEVGLYFKAFLISMESEGNFI